MVQPNGTVKIIGFGLTRLMKHSKKMLPNQKGREQGLNKRKGRIVKTSTQG